MLDIAWVAIFAYLKSIFAYSGVSSRQPTDVYLHTKRHGVCRDAYLHSEEAPEFSTHWGCGSIHFGRFVGSFTSKTNAKMKSIMV